MICITRTNTGIFSGGSDIFGITTNGSERLRIDANGNVGIGFTTPDRSLQIASDINIVGSNASLLGAGGTQFAITGSSATGLTKKLTLGIDTTDNYGVIQAGNTSGTNYALSLNPAGGNVGIGTTSPTYQLHATGNVGIGGSLTFTNAFNLINTTNNNNLNFDVGTGSVIIGGGIGKIDVGTVDPPYFINGIKYATYLTAMTGVKEETTGVVRLSRDNPTGRFKYIIDFNNLESGSDLWLFKNVSDWGANMKNLVVLLSTNSNNAKVWYEKDPANNRLTIFGNCNCEVSFRLTAPRFDYAMHGNIHDTQDGGGFRPGDINQTYVASGSAEMTPVTFENDPFASLSFDDQGYLIVPKLKVGSLILDPSVASVSAQLSIVNSQLSLNTDPNYTSAGPSATAASQSFDLGGKIASLEERIADLENKINSHPELVSGSQEILNQVQNDSTNSATLAVATSSAEIATDSTQLTEDEIKLALTDPTILFATSSANTSKVGFDSFEVSEATVSGMLRAYKTEIQDSLKVFGQTTIGNTIVAGHLTVDGTLSIENGSEINVAGVACHSSSGAGMTNGCGILYLQKSSLAQGLDIFDGKVTIDKEGNIKAKSVVVDQIKVNQDKSAGTGKILAGQIDAIIENSFVDEKSVILLTAKVPLTQTMAVVDKVKGGFLVKLARPELIDVNFDYLIVGVVAPEQTVGPTTGTP